MAENLPPTTVAREPVATEDYSNEGDGDGGGGWEDFEADGGDAFAGQDDDDPLPDPHANDMQVRETEQHGVRVRAFTQPGFCSGTYPQSTTLPNAGEIVAA